MPIYEKYIKVAGVTFEGRQQIIEDLHGHEIIRLEHEPNNEYDPNAVAVYVQYPPEAKMEDAKIGYVPKEIVSEVKLMMSEEYFHAEIDEIIGGGQMNGKHFNYGVIVSLKASYGQLKY